MGYFEWNNIYITLPGLSIKQSGKKGSYMHCPQHHSKCQDLQCTFRMLLSSNTNFWRKVSHMFLLSLPKHRTRAQRNENVEMQDI